MAQAAVAHVEGQQHPIKLYLVVWGWLFVLSTCSYLVDYFGIHLNPKSAIQLATSGSGH